VHLLSKSSGGETYCIKAAVQHLLSLYVFISRQATAMHVGLHYRI